ncbi:MAG: glutamine-hydrolyzing carbamoyl-phosphate synthase small subunit [bacterium]
MPHALLVLEDGTIIKAQHTGARKDVFGEIVFNTSMTGYEEAFTDPSYAGQILLMTYPLIGNYGLRKKSFESDRVQIRALIVKAPFFSSYRGMHLDKFLTQSKIPCLYDIDTRALTLKIREYGTMKALVVASSTKVDLQMLLRKLNKTPHPDTENLVGSVSCTKKITHFNGSKRIIMIDCGVKKSILYHLKKYATVYQVPYDTSFQNIEKLKPHGIVISNGPGNPAHQSLLSTTAKSVEKLINKYPLLGICLGHQILGLVLGFKTYKLKFGHRGSNHAVKHLRTKKIYITSQNHGYALCADKNLDAEITWVNVNDGTVEGIRHRERPVFSVQFHPEAAPGPHDTWFLFKEFMELTSCPNART